MAMQLVARISKAVDHLISIRTFFDHPTIAALADHVEALYGNTPSEPVSARRENAAPPQNREEETGYSVKSEAHATSAPMPAFDDAGAIAEDRPLLDLIESGELASIDAVAVTCIPDWLVNQ